mmetsp:Transcript_28143/g.45608  ORF Transcript_28143/g.45608 Transcript_28143/m.45608 type:complete len:179 (-) Transcript_28143:242-778(-)
MDLELTLCFVNLPDEIWTHVLFLTEDFATVCAFARTSKRFRGIARHTFLMYTRAVLHYGFINTYASISPGSVCNGEFHPNHRYYESLYKRPTSWCVRMSLDTPLKECECRAACERRADLLKIYMLEFNGKCGCECKLDDVQATAWGHRDEPHMWLFFYMTLPNVYRHTKLDTLDKSHR